MGSIVQKECAWEGAHGAFTGRSLPGVCMVYLVRSGEGSMHRKTRERSVQRSAKVMCMGRIAKGCVHEKRSWRMSM